MKEPKIENVHVSGMTVDKNGEIQGTFAVGWEAGGARYHVWCDRDLSLAAHFDGPVLYKNPPRGLGYEDPGRFNTRYLDANRGVGKTMVPLALQYVRDHGLVEKERLGVMEEERETAAIGRAARRERALGLHGKIMLSALKMLADGKDLSMTQARLIATTAVIQAENLLDAD